MKPKFLKFPLLALALASSATAGQFIWTGATDSTWTTTTNWDITTSAPVSTDAYPIPGSTYASDFLNIKNNGDLTALVPGTTPGADAVYNPGAGVTTTFGAATTGGRGFVIGTGNGPSATPPNVKGYASLTISSGTIAAVRNANVGSEPYMANRADVNLLINGGNLDLSAHVNNFRLIQEGFTDVNGPIKSTITIDSGSLSCRVLDLVYDAEADPSTVHGIGTINLNGGTMTVARFARTAASNPGQTSFTINLNGGTLRPFNTQTSPNVFFADLADMKGVVKSGGAIIDTNTFNANIAESLEHDPALGASPDGGLIKNGAGNLTLSGASTYTGGTTINTGRIILSNDSAAGTGSITMAATGTEIQLAASRTIANPLVISDTGDLKTIFCVNAPGASLTGPITINETNIDNFQVRSDANCFLTFSGKISGAGGIYKYQTGWLTLNNATNDFTGGAKITQGILNFFNGALGTTGNILMAGGTLRWGPGASDDLSGRLVMQDATNAILSTGDENTFVTFANAIGNNSTALLDKQGTGWLTLQQPSTHTGGTTVTAGTLNAFAGGFGSSGNLTMNGGTLRWAAGNTEDISSRLVMVAGKTATLAVADAADNVTLANAIGGSTNAALVKSGSGILTLEGANNYTGTTTVSGGTLRVNGSLDAASAVTVTGGNLGGTGTVGGSVVVEAAGNLAPGASAGTLAIGGALDISAMAGGAGKLKFELDSLAATNDVINVSGNLTIGTGLLGIGDLEITNLGGLQVGTYTLITSAGITGGNTLDAANLSGPIATGFQGELQLSGNNLVLVVTAASGFSAWQTANGTTGGIDEDHDGDGVDNGTEYFLFGNANSTGFTALPGVVNNSVTWVKATTGYSGVYNTDFFVQTSDTLEAGSWVTAPLGTNPGEVEITGNNVKYTFPSGTKKFARLKVTGP